MDFSACGQGGGSSGGTSYLLALCRPFFRRDISCNVLFIYWISDHILSCNVLFTKWIKYLDQYTYGTYNDVLDCYVELLSSKYFVSKTMDLK